MYCINVTSSAWLAVILFAVVAGNVYVFVDQLWNMSAEVGTVSSLPEIGTAAV
jgi:hypothetical protein